jgi:PKD repeat protein
VVAWIEAEPEEGEPPLKVQFTARIKGGTPPYTVQWTFDDDSPPSSKTNPIHTYTEPGSYWPELFVTDSAGDEDDDDLEIMVE